MRNRISLRGVAIKWFSIGVVCGCALSILGLSIAQTKEQDRRFGASYLGMCHKDWPCARSLKVFEGLKVKRVGWLHMTFGAPECPCAQRFLELPGEKEIRVHLTNGTCFRERGRVCGPLEPFRGLSIQAANRKLERKNPQLINRLKTSWEEIRPILEKAKQSEVKVLLSPCLECPLSGKAREALLELAGELFPGVPLVDSVMTQRCLKGFICEKHGASPKVKSPCIIDSDGDDFRDINISRFQAAGGECEVSFLWSKGMNLLPPTGFIDPRERKGADALSRSEVRALRRALTP